MKKAYEAYKANKAYKVKIFPLLHYPFYPQNTLSTPYPPSLWFA